MQFNPMKVSLNGFAISFKILSAHCGAILDCKPNVMIKVKGFGKFSDFKGSRSKSQTYRLV